ncbi:MAG: hypothetical protein WBE34_14045 [Candidatus Nitrosopolaris sp.]
MKISRNLRRIFCSIDSRIRVYVVVINAPGIITTAEFYRRLASEILDDIVKLLLTMQKYNWTTSLNSMSLAK